MLTFLIGLAAFAAIYYYLTKSHKYWIERGVKQTSPVLIAGDSWGVLTRTRSFADMICEVYNACPNTRYSGMYQFLTPTLVLKDPNLIKQITVKDFDHFVDHRQLITFEADPYIASNLAALKGQRWKEIKSLITPVFTSSKMKQMFVLMSECAEDFVSYFLYKKGDLITVEMKDIFTRYANDIIATTAFGIKCDSLEEPNNEFYTMGKRITTFGLWRTVKIFALLFVPKINSALKMGIFTNTEEEFFINLVRKTIETRKKYGIIRPDLIQLMMEANETGFKNEENINENDTDFSFPPAEESVIEKSQKNQQPKITNTDIVAHALGFFLAGFDGVSNLMCFTSYELGVNSEIQKRLQNEVDEAFKSCNGKITYEALLKMKYLDMVISESLRKWPNAVFGDRICTKPYTIQPDSPDEKPVHLKENDTLWLPILGLHRDPKYFPEPEKFDPERFSDENKDKIVPYSYIPFGAGPRSCIGNRFAILETKVLLFHLLSKFDIVPVEKTQIPLKLNKKQINLVAEKGFWFGLKRRGY